MKIINNKVNKLNNNVYLHNTSNYKGNNKFFVPSNKEWYNDIYSYNNNNLSSTQDKLCYKFIKAYFNMYNNKLEKAIKIRKPIKRQRLLSINKIYINKLEIKHNNDIVNINIFIYDRINNIMSNKLHEIKKNFFSKNKLLFNNNLLHIYNIFVKNKLSLVYKKLNLDIKFDNNKRLSIIYSLFNKYNNSITSNLIYKYWKKIFFNEINILYYEKFFKFNKLKYENIYLNKLQRIMSKLYKKKVIFNIICLKTYYLSSDILTELLVHKIKNRNNKVSKTFDMALKNIKTPVFRKNIINRKKREVYNNNLLLRNNLNTKQDNLNFNLGKNNFIFDNMQNNVFNKLNNKFILGVRLESAGRLTRRFTAQRSVKQMKYIGTLKNVDSSFKGLSTQIIRNKKKSNLQFSKLSSENRIGSFGIKGWINSI